MDIRVQDAIKHFAFQGTCVDAEPYGNGHINDTYCLICRTDSGETIRYILQKMNTQIFTDPEGLMENIVGVTRHLRKKIAAKGGNPERETLNVIDTCDGASYYKDEADQYWRAYTFIEDAVSYDTVERPEDFYESAYTFGNFQQLLADYPAKELHETIPNFHNTKVRYDAFEKAVADDICGRAESVADEIRFVREHRRFSTVLTDMLKEGLLPLRVTHNDTKLNNIMIDKATHKGICVIDLDTVMPGLSLYDFGDAIRFGASTAAEDETDLSKVSCSLELFEMYVKGFIRGCANSLTANELSMMATGAIVMTYECGMRFLTDYLQGDTYFKTHRPGHNLDRTRTQLRLVADMEAKLDKMNQIVEKYAKATN